MLWLLEIFQTSILLIRSVCFQPCLLLSWERIFHMKRMSGEGAKFNRQQRFNLFCSLGSLLYLRLHKRFQIAATNFRYKTWSVSRTNSFCSIFDPVLHGYISDPVQKHCQRHNGPEDWVHLTKVTSWVHITNSNTYLDQISSSESRPSIDFKISTKHRRLN